MNQASSAASDRNLQTSDITTNNASSTKHGLLPKLDNTATHFIDMTGVQRALTLTDLPTGTVVQRVSTNFATVDSTTTIIPFDDTIPQITEGKEFMTQAITPKSTTNRLLIQVTIMLGPSASDWCIAALFQDATANALAANAGFQGTGTGALTISLTHEMAAGTTSATTFRVRGGPSSGTNTLTFNGQSAARRFGGATVSNITITEVKA